MERYSRGIGLERGRVGHDCEFDGFETKKICVSFSFCWGMEML